MITVTCDFCGKRAVGRLTLHIELMYSEFPIDKGYDICAECFEIAENSIKEKAESRKQL